MTDKYKAKKLAQKILSELKGQPGQFLPLHKQHSGDQRWEMGLIPRYGPQGLKCVQETLFQVKVGELVDQVLESRFGFHIIMRKR